ncbi:MAG: galactokinase, partial [Oscillospiraceae bacterium]
MIKNIEEVYRAEAVGFQKERYKTLADEFENIYGEKPQRFFSAPGRTEICGNHTDHNKGKVLAAGVSLDCIAAVIPTEDNIIYLTSEGFGEEKVDLNKLDANAHKYGSSQALIKGVAAGLKERGYKIGGFKAYSKSNVLKGSGLSSSAAFEVLIATIMSGLYNGGEVDAVTAAQVSQYAENKYFGKPSGLMDQMACSVGGLIYIDFKDEGNPVIQKVEYDFNRCGHTLCIVDTKGNHADLTPEYAAIPTEMKEIAGYFGKENLRELSKAQVMENYKILREKFGDRAVLRSLHFFDENERVDNAFQALEKDDFNSFAKCMKASGNSSYKYLQNVFASSAPR